MRRIFAFLTRLENAAACNTREQAFELVKSLWIDANLIFETPNHDMRSFTELALHESHGWRDLECDPCYLPNIAGTDVWLYLHHDGTIVIQRMESHSQPILLHKLGQGVLARSDSAVSDIHASSAESPATNASVQAGTFSFGQLKRRAYKYWEDAKRKRI